MASARPGHVEVLQVLPKGCINVDIAGDNRRRPVHAASFQGRLDVCRLLLNWGAKVNPVDELRDTPLHYAAQRGHLSVVKLLVGRGADVRLRNDNSVRSSWQT